MLPRVEFLEPDVIISTAPVKPEMMEK